ncbi:MAG: alpha/beta hydrolase [Pseudomonadales bacterium]|nr:alpha/beta hydrolase [Pseudomonadales bacterium]
MQTGWLENNGARLHYQTAGTYGQAVVFVHGLTCSLIDWQSQLERFKDSNQVAAIDLRGHGQSDSGNAAGSETININSFADDIIALIQHLKLNNVILVGHSMGCRVIMQACHQQPNLIAGLVLIDGSRIGEGSADELEANIRTHIKKIGYVTFHQSTFEPMFNVDSDPAMRDAVMARCALVPEDVGLTAYIGSVRWDALHLKTVLPSIKVPILVLQSTYINDQRQRTSLKTAETSDWMEYVQAEASNVRVETIPDVGHFTMLEQPLAVNAFIETFISEFKLN